MDPLKKDDLLLSRKYGVFQDPDFSAKRNKAIVERTIRKTDMMQKRKQKEYDDLLGERTTAVASFLKHVGRGKHNNVVTYFGRRELARLRGEDIATQLKAKIFNNGQA